MRHQGLILLDNLTDVPWLQRTVCSIVATLIVGAEYDGVSHIEAVRRGRRHWQHRGRGRSWDLRLPKQAQRFLCIPMLPVGKQDFVWNPRPIVLNNLADISGLQRAYCCVEAHIAWTENDSVPHDKATRRLRRRLCRGGGDLRLRPWRTKRSKRVPPVLAIEFHPHITCPLIFHDCSHVTRLHRTVHSRLKTLEVSAKDHSVADGHGGAHGPRCGGRLLLAVCIRPTRRSGG
mmetsp:Transcript_1437/g.2910  ORF Transcript_1437/g.2910 Transcript_1437/m.2910 type:complete len:232 (+) Transcript_1437:2127-2822(+)